MADTTDTTVNARTPGRTASVSVRAVLSVFSVVSAVSLSPSSAAFNGDAVGTAGGQFLKVAPDARGLAMGEAFSAVSEDAAAAYWNPAGLARVADGSIHFTHAVFLDGIYHDFGALAMPLAPVFHRRPDIGPLARYDKEPDWGVLGLSVQYLNAGAIERIDNTRAVDGSFIPQDTAVQASWARSRGDMDYGVTGKLINSKIDRTAVTGAADAGLRWRTLMQSLPWTLSVSAHNFGPGLKFDKETSELPSSYRLAQAVRLSPGQLLAADVVFPSDNDPYAAIGFEAEVALGGTNAGALRAGYNTLRAGSGVGGLAGVSAGAGYRSLAFRLDYAWVPYGDLGHTHRFSVGFRF